MATSFKNLPYKRFVKRVSNGSRKSKYSYLAVQEELQGMLAAAPWRAAQIGNDEVTCTVNSVTATDGNFTTYMSDKYDAYKQGGDGDVLTASQCGYAGCAAYRFQLPEDYGVDVSAVKIGSTSDRFNRSGLRVALVLSDSETPSDDWSVVRGDASDAIVSRHYDVQYEGCSSVNYCGGKYRLEGSAVVVNEILTDSRAQYGNDEFTAAEYPALGTHERFRYLWVYVTIEDPLDHWLWYTKSAKRSYYVEGSGIVVGSSVEVVFAGEVEQSVTRNELVVCKNGVLPKIAKSTRSGVSAVELQLDGNEIEAGEKPLSEASGEEAAIGLSACYAKFSSGETTECGEEIVGLSGKRTGAAFTVVRESVQVPMDLPDGKDSLGVWKITSSALVIPFSLPSESAAKSVKLSWSGLSFTCGKLNVWIKGEYLKEYPADDLKNPELYDANTNEVGGWKLLATFNAAASSDGMVVDAGGVSGKCASLLLTAYADVSDVSPTGASVQGVGEMNVDLVNGVSSGMETGWMPDVSVLY